MVVFLPLTLFSQEPVQRGRIQISVAANTTGSPVKNASVVVRSGSGDFEETVRTNGNGVARLSNVPRGPVHVLVVAPGWKNSHSSKVLGEAVLELSFRLEKDGTSPLPSPSPSPSP